MTFQQLQRLFWMFGLEADVNVHIVYLRTYALLITVASKWYGAAAGQFVADCFVPMGPAIRPGFEDSSLYYQFLPSSWEELVEEHATLQFLTVDQHPTIFEASP